MGDRAHPQYTHNTAQNQRLAKNAIGLENKNEQIKSQKCKQMGQKFNNFFPYLPADTTRYILHQDTIVCARGWAIPGGSWENKTTKRFKIVTTENGYYWSRELELKERERKGRQSENIYFSSQEEPKKMGGGGGGILNP